jgi:hypothetical protein
MALQRKGQAVNLYILTQIVLWLFSVVEIESTLTRGEKQCKRSLFVRIYGKR